MRAVHRPLVMACAIVALIICLAWSAHADQQVCIVERVIDGDTLQVYVIEAGRVERLRLVGIDAPEIGQPFGCAAAWWLRTRLEGHLVTVDIKARDRYGRLLGSVRFGRADPALGLVRAGLAWADRRPYIEAMKAAKSAKLGIWSQANPELPSVYRGRAKRAIQAGRVK